MGRGLANAPYQTHFGAGHYTEMVGHPLADDAAIDSYRPPDPNRPELYGEAARVIREFKDEYWIVGVTVTTIFETAWALRGYQRMLMDLALNPELADRILDIPYQYHLAAAKKLTEMGVDMIWIGDDVGAQNKMLISPSDVATHAQAADGQFHRRAQGASTRRSRSPITPTATSCRSSPS